MNKFQAVLFDCDGVLVDSEPITNGLLRDMLEEQGWKLTHEECFAHFVGKAVMDERLAIEANTGKPLTEAWMTAFRARRNAALQTNLQAIPNIHAAVEQIHLACDGRIACASGADRFKVELQLSKVELMSYFQGRIFSGHEMPRSKPAPDVYLAAAAAVGVHPRLCAVVEDTVTGVMAGLAAGCTVFGYAPRGEHSALHAAGAHHTFTDMAHLPSLLGQKMAQSSFS
ncbi:MAG: HAD family phosphatase [Burkholderiaceae bacterium]|nr:HAD family phosphatase [Burkholderiaceae bacterium]